MVIVIVKSNCKYVQVVVRVVGVWVKISKCVFWGGVGRGGTTLEYEIGSDNPLKSGLCKHYLCSLGSHKHFPSAV